MATYSKQRWQIETTAEFDKWLEGLAARDQKRVIAGIEALRDAGPGLGRPLVDTVEGSRHPNMKELRRGTIRVLFAFDPERTAVLLLGGDKRKRWRQWYEEAVPAADQLFDRHLQELRKKKKRHGKKDKGNGT